MFNKNYTHNLRVTFHTRMSTCFIRCVLSYLSEYVTMNIYAERISCLITTRLQFQECVKTCIFHFHFQTWHFMSLIIVTQCEYVNAVWGTLRTIDFSLNGQKFVNWSKSVKIVKLHLDYLGSMNYQIHN